MPERMKTRQITRRHLIDADTNEIRQCTRNYTKKLACNIKMTASIFMHISGVNKTYETRLDY